MYVNVIILTRGFLDLYKTQWEKLINVSEQFILYYNMFY